MEGQEKKEANRERVRRLVIDPLTVRGFRFAKGAAEDEQRKHLDGLADLIGYMSDAGLRVLEESLRTKGEGSQRCFWPSHASIGGLAEAFEARPLEELPGLLRWFASEAGRLALADERLVSEYLFWKSKKRPPVSVQDRKAVAEHAAEMRSKAERVRDRIRRGFAPLYDDGEWLRWFEATEARVKSFLSQEHGEAA
jgi:hypothetical protein